MDDVDLKRRPEKAAKKGVNRLRTFSMEDAFKLAKEYELDVKYSFKFGYPNIYTNWIRWIEDNNLNLTPFIRWFDDDGNKVSRPPQKDKDGFYNGYGKITLFFDGDVIETFACSDGGPLFDVVLAHCE